MITTIILKMHEDFSYQSILLNENYETLPDLITDFKNLTNIPIIILIPTQTVYMTEIKMTGITRFNSRKVIPYIIEDHLADDIGNLHFSFIRSRNHEHISIAVVEKEKMHKWLDIVFDLFKTKNIMLETIMPDVFLLPFNPESWTVHEDNEIILVRTNQESGFAIDKSQVWIFLRIFLNKTSVMPKRIEFLNNVAIDDNEEKYCNERNIDVVKSNESNITHETNFQNLKQIEINLLQGEFAQHSFLQVNKSLKFICVTLISLWLIILTLSEIFQLSYLNFQKYHLQHQVNQLVAAEFSGKSFDDSIDEMDFLQSTLEHLKESSINNLFIQLFLKSAPVISQSPVQIISMEYFNSHIILQLKTSKFSDIDLLTQRLKSKGFQVEQKDIKISDDAARVELDIYEANQ